MTGHDTCCCRATLDTIDRIRADIARVTEERDRVSDNQDQLDLTNGDRQ